LHLNPRAAAYTPSSSSAPVSNFIVEAGIPVPPPSPAVTRVRTGTWKPITAELLQEKRIELLGAVGGESDTIWTETMTDITEGFQTIGNTIAGVADEAVKFVQRAFNSAKIENPEHPGNPLLNTHPEVHEDSLYEVTEKLTEEINVAGTKITEFRNEVYDTFFGLGETGASKREISDKDLIGGLGRSDPSDLDHPLIRRQSRNRMDIDKIKFGITGVGHEIQRATSVFIEDAKSIAGIVTELVTPRSLEADDNLIEPMPVENAAA